MINYEIYGGLVSALSRGSSWYDAMMSLYNAGYSKEEIEETAGILKSQMAGKSINQNPENSKKENISSQSSLKPAFNQKPLVSIKPVIPVSIIPKETIKSIPNKTQAPVSQYIPPKVNQIVSSYSANKEPIISKDAIKYTPPKTQAPVSQYIPPKVNNVPIPQPESDYSSSSNIKKPRGSIIILFILLLILLGSLAGLFIFKDKIFELLSSIGS
jgi:hypothetical protein